MSYWEDAGVVTLGAILVLFGVVGRTSGGLIARGLFAAGSLVASYGLFSGIETAVRARGGWRHRSGVAGVVSPLPVRFEILLRDSAAI